MKLMKKRSLRNVGPRGFGDDLKKGAVKFMKLLSITEGRPLI